MHYYIIIIPIVIIVIWQLRSFNNTKRKISAFRDIFPKEGSDKLKLELLDENEAEALIIISSHDNSILKVIVSSINNYLIKNRSAVSDFHLMKDVVDRNCDAKEDEINAQIPVPLYLGLAGTMLGILIGVGSFVYTGGIERIIRGTYDGVEMLLGGVALAMISSIFGLIMATAGSHKAKNAKSEVEKNKNAFLSWIQAELLPNISTDTSGALTKMTHNLSKFNETFGGNTEKLQDTLQQINQSITQQAQLIQAVENLNIGALASVNIQVYNALKNSTNEIGEFGKFLNAAVQTSHDYLSKLQGLNDQLDGYEKRTQVIEAAGKFFKKNETWLAENFYIANLEVQKALERFNTTTNGSLARLQESFAGQVLDLDRVMKNQNKTLEANLGLANEAVAKSLTDTNNSFNAAIAAQQTALITKLQETPNLVEVLTDLKSIKDSIQKDLKKAPEGQNAEIEQLTAGIEKLTKEIHSLANTKLDGNSMKQEMSIPRWLKILIISGGVLISIASLMFIIQILIN